MKESIKKLGSVLKSFQAVLVIIAIIITALDSDTVIKFFLRAFDQNQFYDRGWDVNIRIVYLLYYLLIVSLSLPAVLKLRLFAWKAIKKSFYNDFNKKLEYIKDQFRRKDKKNIIHSQLIIQRGMTPNLQLNNCANEWNGEEMLLIRTKDEIKSPHSNIVNKFSELQERDYSAYFNHLKKSYYVTSVNDHKFWIINNKSKLDYYFRNYMTHKKIYRDSNNSPTGIYRAFIFDKSEIELDRCYELFPDFKVLLQNIYEKINNPTETVYDALFLKISEKLNLTKNYDGKILPDSTLFLKNKNIAFLFICFAAKMHKDLGIKFSFVSKEYLNKSDLDFKKYYHDCSSMGLNWKLLGCGIFDEVVLAQVFESIDESTIKYDFDFTPVDKDHIMLQLFNDRNINEFDFLKNNNDYKENDKYLYDLLMKDPDFNQICDNYATHIKKKSNPLCFKVESFFYKLKHMVNQVS